MSPEIAKVTTLIQPSVGLCAEATTSFGHSRFSSPRGSGSHSLNRLNTLWLKSSQRTPALFAPFALKLLCRVWLQLLGLLGPLTLTKDRFCAPMSPEIAKVTTLIQPSVGLCAEATTSFGHSRFSSPRGSGSHSLNRLNTLWLKSSQRTPALFAPFALKLLCRFWLQLLGLLGPLTLTKDRFCAPMSPEIAKVTTLIQPSVGLCAEATTAPWKQLQVYDS